MILTGSQIIEDLLSGEISIDPFDRNAVNPNSYNYRLGERIKVFDHFDGQRSIFREVVIPEDGIVLSPRQMYLGHTFEVIGSHKYAMSLIGRSSLGRLGLFLQLSANLGHTMSRHCWTLEIMCAHPIRIYPRMIIGQVSFWHNEGTIVQTSPYYALYNDPLEAAIGVPL
jgi:dCTP deaminase